MSLDYQAMEKFIAAYPLLMKQQGETAFNSFGLEFGYGWYPLAFELLGLFDDLQTHTGQAVGISQTKEKFGSLRVYCRLPVESVEQDIIETAFEHLSTTICDFCGAPGRIGEHKGLWATRCDAHRVIKHEQQADKVRRQSFDRFLGYERSGVDTSGLVYVDVTKSPDDDELADLNVYELPERIYNLKTGIRDKLAVSEYKGREVDYLAERIKDLECKGKNILSVTDGSRIANRILGRPEF
jgi:hypothetical protein